MNAQQLAALGTMVREAIETHCKVLGEVFAQQLAERDTLIENLTAQIQQLQNSQTPGYDDTEVKHLIADLTVRTNAHAEIVKGYADSLPKPYDDTALRNEIAESLKFQTESFESLLEQFKNAPKPADGRDALQIEVLPAIDEQKSYTRGTYARHAGGLWRAFEQTSGLRGWECIVVGVKSVDTRWEGKTLIETTTLSDGTTHETRKSFAVQEYKGVFAHGEHEQGDTVTWAGSLWHCNVTGTKALPGDGSADWTLAVKKGRDGREVVKTERKEGPVQI